MGAAHDGGATPAGNRTKVERTSERDLVVTRVFDAPARIVFQAWTTPELFMRWWAPKSMGVPLLSCDMDVRTGGTYRLAFGHDSANTFEFFGKYIEVVPDTRIVWTNEEETGGAVTTVSFEEKDGRTHLTYHDHYPSKQALDEATDGMGSILPEQFAQLDELLVRLGSEGGLS